MQKKISFIHIFQSFKADFLHFLSAKNIERTMCYSAVYVCSKTYCVVLTDLTTLSLSIIAQLITEDIQTTDMDIGEIGDMKKCNILAFINRHIHQYDSCKTSNTSMSVGVKERISRTLIPETIDDNDLVLRSLLVVDMFSHGQKFRQWHKFKTESCDQLQALVRQEKIIIHQDTAQRMLFAGT